VFRAGTAHTVACLFGEGRCDLALAASPCSKVLPFLGEGKCRAGPSEASRW
jgi:hypothetical protein